MAQLRNGPPVAHSGWLNKEGNNGHHFPRFMRLCGTALSNSHDAVSPPSWEVSVLDCPVTVGSRPRELIVQLPRRRLSYFAANDPEHEEWRNALERARRMRIENYYNIGEVLGEGAFAKVHIGEDPRTKEQFAIKVIDKKGYDAREMEFILREMRIMMEVVHPHIVDTYDIFESKSLLHLVIEYMRGGELFDIIADQGHLSEQRASQVVRDIIRGVNYLHDTGVVHCDIKPENILCKTREWPLCVKLCDFGLANFYDSSAHSLNTMTAMIGTPGYVAPEIVNREPYGPPVDMWACGVVLYVMLSGRMPFYGRDDVECLRRTAAGRYTFPDREWSNVSDDAKSLVKALLQVRPEKRLTAKAALQHKWLAVPEDLSDAPIPNDLRGIHSSRRKFRKAVMAAVSIERMKNVIGGVIADRSPTTAQPPSGGTSRATELGEPQQPQASEPSAVQAPLTVAADSGAGGSNM